MATVYLGLGTNLGDKEANIKAAVNEINKRIGKVTSLSAFYVTEPWGFVSDNTFLNAACCADTYLSAFEILNITQEIEKELGRLKKSFDNNYSDRIIDIDILLYDDIIINTSELIIPHPLMTERSFVMEPLIEIAPYTIHPILKKCLKDI